ncbi:glycohydrolase toxin TNT-related protein [Listeria grandensis]|uniref:glycohydrolase toxin TNT-related protein n=1 Tax=Listeria grandensis TaxID=1494963 RepID=UPI00164DF482|nr:glycohydrolase toxin TNT-related protein [Listeria grandensis]MBC6316467.1 glycohydrolase toxin TNT-related protein [Listeria grandensis]
MTRIDIAEVTHFSQQLRASNQELKQYVNAVKQAVIAYINDTSISGDAIASSKEYYAGAYFPLCASIKQALDLSEQKIQKYITDFHSQVDASPNSRLDVDGIHDLNQKITGFENRLESVTSQLTAINGTGHASELNYLATQIFEAHKKEEILNKFMDFEQSHRNFFYEVGELAHYIKQALDNIQQNLKFDGKTGMYHLEKLNPATFSQLTKMYASQQEIDDKIREIEEIGLTPNIPKGNSAGFITIDGKMSTEATLDFVNQQMIYWQSETVFREVLGVGSFYRAVYGVDAVSGKHISDGQRLLDGALVLTQYGAPVLGLAKFTARFEPSRVVSSAERQINAVDKLKLEKWSYPPNEAKYLKYKAVYDNPKYYNQTTGDINWPPNNGFSGAPKDTIIKEGSLLDRYGEPRGEFFSPKDVPYEMRALALHSDEANYYVYRVLNDFDAKGGVAAPWFDRPGGGTQYIKYHSNGEAYTMKELIEEDLIEFVSLRKWESQ